MDLSKIENFQDAVATVMGLGRYKQGSGLGAAKWLIRHGAQTIITDLKDEKELEESMSLVTEWYEKYKSQFPDRAIYQPLFVLGRHREEDFTEVDIVVQNPGVPSESEYIQTAKRNGVSIESDVSIFFRFTPDPVIAVTGTKGKTTTTKLIGEMLLAVDEGAVIAGNINVSPLEYLDQMLSTQRQNLTVIELSSWLLESLPQSFVDLQKGPDIAVITNVYPDHLNRYETFEDYIRSKEILVEHQRPDQYTVLNYDHALVRKMEDRVKGVLFWCSKEYMDHNGCYIKDGVIVFRIDGEDEVILPYDEVGLKGVHNIENILTSTCAALLRGIPTEVVQRVLKEFKGVSDRQELVREVDEVTYINDTTATNPDAVIAALKRFGEDGEVILIAGGVDKKMQYDALAEEIVKTCKRVILFEGDASDMLQEKIGGRVPVQAGMKSMREAVQQARFSADKGDIVVLSPGAASFNMFKNEFDRGEQFREEVRNL